MSMLPCERNLEVPLHATRLAGMDSRANGGADKQVQERESLEETGAGQCRAQWSRLLKRSISAHRDIIRYVRTHYCTIRK
jgi:hypothetical protein